MKPTKKYLKLYGLITAIVLFAAVFLSACSPAENLESSDIPDAFKLESTTGASLMTATEAAEKVLPSVVGVLSYSNSADLSAHSEGTGIIMSDDGYIITNAHVVEDSELVKVVLEDDRVYSADSDDFWYDVYTDLAVIKIETSGLVEAAFGNSEELRIAQDVLAIGNPGGLQYRLSVTKGIVSSLSRPYEPIADSGYVINCIQTDAAINPGNSGGALINLYGQVVGINSAKIADVNFEGMGFAIAVNDAQPIISELRQNGYIGGRTTLGMAGRVVNVNVRESGASSLKTITGFYVESITNTELSAAGLSIYNIITEIAGMPITSVGSVSAAIKEFDPGDSVILKVYVLGTRTQSYYNVTTKEITAKLIEFKP